MKKILFQFDSDLHPSAFDRVVAMDSGVDELFSYGVITPDSAVPLVHGAIFTRKVSDLKSTAIFVGGSDVRAGEAIFRKIRSTFFGPMRVSVMLDSNGSNTTAAAAVASASQHLKLSQTTAVIFGGTGPVGYRAAQLLLSQGATVKLVSRSATRASEACIQLMGLGLSGQVTPHAATTPEEAASLSEGTGLVIAAGAAGVEFLSLETLQNQGVQVAVDVNAVPPVGIRGVESVDKGTPRGKTFCYGALGVGHLKMKVHRMAIEKLFTQNDLELETMAIYDLASQLISTHA